MSRSKKSKPIKWIEDLTRIRQYRSNFLQRLYQLLALWGLRYWCCVTKLYLSICRCYPPQH